MSPTETAVTWRSTRTAASSSSIRRPDLATPGSGDDAVAGLTTPGSIRRATVWTGRSRTRCWRFGITVTDRDLGFLQCEKHGTQPVVQPGPHVRLIDV